VIRLASLRQIRFRGCANVGTFTLLADEAEELDGTGTGSPEPVRGAGVELGSLPWFENEVVFAEDQAEPAVEDIDPVVSLVGRRRAVQDCQVWSAGVVLALGVRATLRGLGKPRLV
jgi:hypothetical protein